MLYVVEMAFTRPDKQEAWDAWYMEHLDILLSVPGFHTAQRFLCLTPCPAPYVAIYTVDSPDVFESAPYRARGGRDSTGEWKSLMLNWDRNVFAGIDRAPAVAAGELLLLTEAEPGGMTGASVDFIWLVAAGLDRTVARRGLAVVDAIRGAQIPVDSRGDVRAYRPLMSQRLSGHA
jgi:hypothetical protein